MQPEGPLVPGKSPKNTERYVGVGPNRKPAFEISVPTGVVWVGICVTVSVMMDVNASPSDSAAEHGQDAADEQDPIPDTARPETRMREISMKGDIHADDSSVKVANVRQDEPLELSGLEDPNDAEKRAEMRRRVQYEKFDSQGYRHACSF